MLFNSPDFLFLFLPVTVAGFFLVARLGTPRAAIAWLVAASVVFYGAWDPRYLLLIGASIGVNFLLGQRITDTRSARPRVAQLLTALGVALNLGALGYFKYANFFVETMNALTGSAWHLEKIVLPLAISFFTFQQIAYLVDARKGIAEEHDFLDYCLFVTFFPQLIAGPIVHHSEMLPQFKSARTFRPQWSNFSVGLTIFTVGLFKKVVVADSIAVHVSPIFTAAEAGVALHFMESAVAMGGYTLQLYFDFSGYSDMAIGLGRMFGIRLPLNFDSPYKATGIIDFWRRWHMTLSRFLRDYLYFPLGGNRKGPIRRYANLLVVMLLGGLWHGAGWTFVFWGLLHGLYLVVNHLWRAVFPAQRSGAIAVVFARSFTLFWVMVAWVFFRAETFEGASVVFQGFMNLPNTIARDTPGIAAALAGAGFSFEGPHFANAQARMIVWGVFWLAFVWFLPNTQQLVERFRPTVRDEHRPGRAWRPPLTAPVTWRPTIAWGVAFGLLLAVAVTHLTRVSEFLYFQF